MNIVTLNHPGLDWQTRILAEKIQRDHPDAFRAIIAIRNGGSYIARSFMKSYPQRLVTFFGEVDLQRPSTKYKKGILARVLPHVPLWIVNSMRYFEAFILKLRQQIREPKIPKCELPNDIVDQLQNGIPEILLIDDAVDSGNTMRGVINAILKINPKTKVKVMAITVTTKSPLVMPDYYIYYNSTLVRFPWSKDYKNL